jgi:tryptophan synthase alpha chain
MTNSLVDTRVTRRFAALKNEGRKGLVTFVTAGDPTLATFEEILSGLPQAGADVIEIGVPFSDPMADGPSIQLSSQRALAHHTSLRDVLATVKKFRSQNQTTPLILMGYFNPIYRYGSQKFAQDAADAGVDGVIVVDLPPEEADELDVHLKPARLHMIFLTAPTSSDVRLPTILARASGFVYYVSVAGVTGTKAADEEAVKHAVMRLRRHTALPIAVGFGIKTPAQARAIAAHADAAVVGSAIVDVVAAAVQSGGDPVGQALAFVKGLSQGLRR